MARYIDADALESKKFISWTCPEFFDEGAREQQAYQIGWNNAIEAVMENEPTADVVERKKGEWIDAVIPNDNGDLLVQVCDQCNTFFPLAYTGGGHHFCPNCGADMKGEDNE